MQTISTVAYNCIYIYIYIIYIYIYVYIYIYWTILLNAFFLFAKTDILSNRMEPQCNKEPSSYRLNI